LLDLNPRTKDLTVTQRVVIAAKEWSKRLAATATNETRTFIRSFVSRIVLGMANIDVFINKRALWRLLLDSRLPTAAGACRRSGLLTLKINVSLQRCRGEVRLISPPGVGKELPEHPARSLIKAVARARSWYGRIVRGELSGRRSIARAISLEERYVSRIFRSAFLAPDIVESILDGRQPLKMIVRNLQTQLPVEWALGIYHRLSGNFRMDSHKM
jgi:site-specific DNA recombinase